jgi:hypothetical protein
MVAAEHHAADAERAAEYFFSRRTDTQIAADLSTRIKPLLTTTIPSLSGESGCLHEACQTSGTAWP